MGNALRHKGCHVACDVLEQRQFTNPSRPRLNERTLEKWEQGRAKPNPQAAALLLLVRKYPYTLERLEKLAAGLTALTRVEMLYQA